jgi:cytochrome c biogenesis protein CcmG, thiol:disulfide interchange protein DsbE
MADVLAQPEQDPGSTGRRRQAIAPVVALLIAAVVAGFVWVAAVNGGGEADTAETRLLDQPAPEVRTTTLDGEPFDLSTRRGSWVVLNFFATWCPPCVREHPELVRFAETQAAQGTGVELHSVVFNDEVGDVREFFAENGGGWPILTDPDGTISVAFGVAKAPETWIIDPDGVVRARIISNVDAELLTEMLGRLQGTGSS